MSQTDSAGVSAPPPVAPTLVCSPLAPDGVIERSDPIVGLESWHHPASPGLRPGRPPPVGGISRERIGVSVLASDSCQWSCNTAMSDAPTSGSCASLSDSAALTPLCPPTAAWQMPLLQPGDVADFTPARRSADSGWESPGPHRERSSRQVEAWLGQVPRPTSDSDRDGDSSPCSPAGSQDAADRQLAVVQACISEDIGAARNAAKSANTRAQPAERFSGGTSNAPVGLPCSQHGSSDVGRTPSDGLPSGRVPNQQRVRQAPAALLLPEPEYITAAAGSDDSGADLHPARLALALRVAASPAPATERLVRRGGSRRRRVGSGVVSDTAAQPLGLGLGSGLPPVGRARTVATSSKVTTAACSDDGKSSSLPPSTPSFAPGTSLLTQSPSRLVPSFLHVLPAPFADPVVEQAYQAHFDRLKVAVDIITWTMGIAAYLSVLFRTVKRGIVAGRATPSLLPQIAMVLANVALMAFTVHSAARVPGYVRWRRLVVIPASMLSTIGTATTFQEFGILSMFPPASWDPSGWPAFLLEVLTRKAAVEVFVSILLAQGTPTADTAWLLGICNVSLILGLVIPRHCVAAHQPFRSLQGKYEAIAGRVDCCLGWLPSSFLPARWAPEQQCVAVLSLLQLLLVWALPIVLLSRWEKASRARWARASAAECRRQGEAANKDDSPSQCVVPQLSTCRAFVVCRWVCSCASLWASVTMLLWLSIRLTQAAVSWAIA